MDIRTKREYQERLDRIRKNREREEVKTGDKDGVRFLIMLVLFYSSVAWGLTLYI